MIHHLRVSLDVALLIKLNIEPRRLGVATGQMLSFREIPFGKLAVFQVYSLAGRYRFRF